MIRQDRDHYVLTTGRKIYANHGLISIAYQVGVDLAEGRSLGFEIAAGLDGPIVELQPAWENGDKPSWDEFTASEKIELADFMLEQWRAFKQAAQREELSVP